MRVSLVVIALLALVLLLVAGCQKTAETAEPTAKAPTDQEETPVNKTGFPPTSGRPGVSAGSGTSSGSS